MKSTILRLASLGILSLGLCSIGFAQDPQDQQDQKGVQDQQDQRQKPGDTDKDKAGKTMTVTGCLMKGDQADEYSLKGSDGKMYDLHSTSSSVKMSDHVNHKVTVTGKMMTDQNKKGETEMNVTTMKMVSPSC
jgi:uncharacterized protein YdeI (BOF family)